LAATGVWYGLATWAIPDLLGRAFEGEDLGRFGQVVRSLGRPYVDRYWRHAADLGLILLGAGTAVFAADALSGRDLLAALGRRGGSAFVALARRRRLAVAVVGLAAL